mgnify:FL=1
MIVMKDLRKSPPYLRLVRKYKREKRKLPRTKIGILEALRQQGTLKYFKDYPSQRPKLKKAELVAELRALNDPLLDVWKKVPVYQLGEYVRWKKTAQHDGQPPPPGTVFLSGAP